jgi:predicted porin
MGTAAFSGINSFDGGATGRIIRHEKSMMYISPVVSGFKATVEYAFGNDNATTANSFNNSNTNTGFSLQYNAGPVNAVYYYGNEKAGTNGAAGATTALGTAPAVVLPAGTDITWTMLAGNYNLGALTVMGGYTTTKHNAATALEDSSSWNIAAKYVLNPTWEFTGNYLVRDTNLASTYDATLIGLGANYNLDKQTNLYGRYEGIKFDNNSAKASYDQSIWAFGLRYQF